MGTLSLLYLTKGSIVVLKDGYRIYSDKELNQYYYSKTYKEALNISFKLTRTL